METASEYLRSSSRRHAQSIILLVSASIGAGLGLRLSGFVGGAYSWFVMASAGDDSWQPMRLAYAHAMAAGGGHMYDIFFAGRVKFQYPPSSLLVLSAVRQLGYAPTDRLMNLVVWVSILATVPVVYATCLRYMRDNRHRLTYTRREQHAIAAAFAVATLFFYPIMISWRLGQIQGLLNLLFALSCLCWVYGRRGAAGAMVGASCLVKPQFALFLLWAATRRECRFLLGQALAFAAGVMLSVRLYGLQPFVDYVAVLRFISRHGEIFWDNTSVNGLVNRLFHPDRTLIFDYHGWVDYNPVVYASTMLSSAAIIGFALFALRSLHRRDAALDFMAAAFCFTLASPIAWGHHFGIALPLLAILLIALQAAPRPRRTQFMVCASICYLIFAVDWNVTDLLGGTSLTILQSWRLFGAFALLWLLHALSRGPVPARVQVAPRSAATITSDAAN